MCFIINIQCYIYYINIININIITVYIYVITIYSAAKFKLLLSITNYNDNSRRPYRKCYFWWICLLIWSSFYDRAAIFKLCIGCLCYWSDHSRRFSQIRSWVDDHKIFEIIYNCAAMKLANDNTIRSIVTEYHLKTSSAKQSVTDVWSLAYNS